MKVEERLAEIKLVFSEHACGHPGVAKAESYLMYKLREAVDWAKYLMNKPGPTKYSPRNCHFCGASGEDEEDPEVKDHKPDCAAQKFLES